MSSVVPQLESSSGGGGVSDLSRGGEALNFGGLVSLEFQSFIVDSNVKMLQSVCGSTMIDEQEIGCPFITLQITNKNRYSFLVTREGKARQSATLNMQHMKLSIYDKLTTSRKLRKGDKLVMHKVWSTKAIFQKAE